MPMSKWKEFGGQNGKKRKFTKEVEHIKKNEMETVVLKKMEHQTKKLTG